MPSTTFSNLTPVIFPDNATTSSSIVASGLTGNVVNVTVTLFGFTHQSAYDMDFLLVAPDGTTGFVFMADAITQAQTAVDLTFSDSGVSVLPHHTSVSSGTFKPTDYDSPGETGADFGVPGALALHPGPFGTNTFETAFAGQSPNGTWTLYADDQYLAFTGQMSGWSLKLSTGDAPVASAAVAATDEDVAFGGTLIATDADNDALTYRVVDKPLHGSLTVASNGQYLYTPFANYNGTDSFKYVANDGGVDSAPATVSLTINKVNDAPTFAVGTGKFTTDLGAAAVGVALQADGKIVVLGGNGALTRYNADTTFDTSFGAVASGGLLPGGATDILIQPDGKFLIAGSNDPGGFGDFVVVRLNSNGSIDTTFGGGDGVAALHVGDPSRQNFPRELALQSDGKIVLIGGYQNFIPDFQDFAAVRFNADGTIDTGFGTGGAMFTGVATTTDVANGVVIQPDGKIVIAGYGQDFNIDATAGGLVRLNPDGTIDKTVVTEFGQRQDDELNDVLLQSDGKIIAVGSTHNNNDPNSPSYDLLLQRYDPNLDPNDPLDHTFGMSGSGRVTVNLGFKSFDEGVRAQLLPDGKIMVLATTSDASHTLLALVRFNADGSFDTMFGDGGKVTTAFDGNNVSAVEMVQQPDGKFVVVGNIGIGSSITATAIARYNIDGSLDQTLRPANTLDGAPTYVKGGPAVVLDSNVVVYDAELQIANNHYFNSTLTLTRDGGANSSDVFGFSSDVTLDSNIVSVSGAAVAVVNQNSGGVLSLRFVGAATQDNVDAVMHAITYANNSANAPSNVQIDWTFSDANTGTYGPGGAKTATGSTTVHIDSHGTPFNYVGSGDLGSHGGGYQVAGVADLNGDGTADVLWRDPASGKLDSWQLLNGNWSKSIDLGSHGAGWTVAATGDFNGDGTSDILFREAATGKLDAWIMQNGNWSKSVDLGSHGTDWKVIGAGDFNGDGTSDILFQNTSTGVVDEWIMKAGNWSASKSLGTHNVSFTRAAIGDFDGDGTSDVLWHNPTTGAVDEWQIKGGNYAGSIGGFSNFNTAYELAAVNDFNGDGRSDILWRNPASGAVDGWVMDHGKWAGSVMLGSYDPAYKLAGTGDFNHAGGADVLWHNQATGQVGTWLLGAV